MKKNQNGYSLLQSSRQGSYQNTYDRSMWYVYIAQAKTGRYYTGVSTDPNRRIREHNAGLGAKFSKDQGALTLLYVSLPYDKSTAWKREIQIKGWTRIKKEKLIRGEWK